MDSFQTDGFSMADIQSAVSTDNEPIFLCFGKNWRQILNITVEKKTPSQLLYCGNLSQVEEENDIVTCGRYVTDFHVDSAGTIRLHRLLHGRKLIIIATSRDVREAAYYNNFKNVNIDYNTKLEWVLRDPSRWDVVIQDQRLLFRAHYYYYTIQFANIWGHIFLSIRELAHNGGYMHFFHTFASTVDEVHISIGQSVGSCELAVAYAKFSCGTEYTEEVTGSHTSKPVTQVGSVQRITKNSKTAKKFTAAYRSKQSKVTKSIKKTKAQNNGRFKRKNYGRKIKKLLTVE